MVGSSAFDYINVLDKALDASWERETLIANNLANVDTPGYKRKDLDFGNILEQELGRSKYESLDAKMRDLNDVYGPHMGHLNPKVYTDYINYSYRIDRNNVDVDQENVELASEQLRYNMLADATTHEFKALKAAMSNGS